MTAETLTWLRAQLPTGYVIIGPETVAAMRRVMDVRDTEFDFDDWITDIAVVETALEGTTDE